MRLGVFVDAPYVRVGDRYESNVAFVRFFDALSEHVTELVVFGRLNPATAEPGVALTERARFVALPHYERLTDARAVLRAWPRAMDAFSANAPGLDAVLLFGPHPLSVGFARVARRAGVPSFLGIREDLRTYVAARVAPGARGWVARMSAVALERAFFRQSRRSPVIAVGGTFAQRYRTAGAKAVLSVFFSLVRDEDICAPRPDPSAAAAATMRVLSVGRLDPEKNPVLLVEIAEQLRRSWDGWRLVVAGDGSLRGELERAVAARGLRDMVDVRGNVPFGPDMLTMYRDADAFLHVSRTEGVPQVLFEAMAARVPIVATDVGDVRSLAVDGLVERAVLIRPDDAAGAAQALERLRRDAELVRRLTDAGAEFVRTQTIDRQAERVAQFIGSQVEARQ